MIYCPKCGTANRDGSRYCNECGGALTASPTRPCPRCGSANEVDALHCQACGLDLTRGQEEAPAEPAREQEEDEPEQESVAADQPQEARAGGLPPWLDSAEHEAEDEGGPEQVPALPTKELGPGAPRADWPAEAIPIEPSVGVPYRAREHAALPATSSDEAAAELFAQAASEEVHASPQAVPIPSRARGMAPWLRGLIAFVVLAAVLAAMLWPLGPLPAAGAPAPVVEADETVGRLPVGSVVLVAFEYDAGLAGEMQPVAEAYLHHLLDREALVLVVSTQPEGAALADMALDRVLPAHSARYGEQVLNLGYVPGGEAAVRALATSLKVVPTEWREGRPIADFPVVEGTGGAREMALIVVLGRDLLSVQRWIEQVGAPYGTPLVAGVPALAEPTLGPYRVTGQLRGVVAGLGGAAAYERLQALPATAGQMLLSVRLGAWTVAALVVLVNLVALVGRLRGRSR